MAKTGHGPHSSKIFVLFYILFVLCRSVYCLCVNIHCTTATGWQPNCSYQIYHILFIMRIYHDARSPAYQYIYIYIYIYTQILTAAKYTQQGVVAVGLMFFYLSACSNAYIPGEKFNGFSRSALKYFRFCSNFI